jgi:hypothetical protein
MRWTLMSRLTSVIVADGEVVWSWRQEHFLNCFKEKYSLKTAGPD